jgi:hypothetical protein
MFDLGVPITASSFYQEYEIPNTFHLAQLTHMRTIMEHIYGALGWLPQWYHFITTLDTSFAFCIEGNKHSNVNYSHYLTVSQEDFQVWAKYPEIAEGNLSIALSFRVMNFNKKLQHLDSITSSGQLCSEIGKSLR